MYSPFAQPRLTFLYLGAWWLASGLVLVALLAPQGAGILAASTLAASMAGLSALLSLVVYYPCRALPPSSANAGKLLLAHGAGAALSSSLWLAAGELLSRGLAGWRPLLPARMLFLEHQALLAVVGLLFYLAAALVHSFALVFEETQRTRTRELSLEVKARDAELAALRAQIDPHFLFNSLHSLAALCGSDPKAARAMAIRLADFFRARLGAARQKLVPLGEELELASAYLEVERVRFGERLSWRLEALPEARQALVPPLLLQPLVENAVRHGIAPRVEGGEILISAAREDTQLEIAVVNPVDEASPRRPGAGVGLSLVRDRLRLSFGRQARLETAAENQEFRVRLVVPLSGENPS
ncbi:MAG TPA: histidine kinase [Thermoanaerobaculia bacterium]|nr:histidine kinase [Thermoanaerobaculia bacterium]